MAASWQIGGDAHTHPFVLAGQRLAYPAANLGALAVLVLALLGLATLVVAIAATAREVAASVRFARGIDARAVHGDVRVIAEERPLAFCAGLWRPRVYVSSGAVELLDDAALQAVLAHERHHQRRRDPLRLAAGRVLERALFWFPGVPALVARQRAWAELGADERVVAEQPASRSALARAMLRFADHDGPGAAVDPARVDQLVGEPPAMAIPGPAVPRRRTDGRAAGGRVDAACSGGQRVRVAGPAAPLGATVRGDAGVDPGGDRRGRRRGAATVTRGRRPTPAGSAAVP